jgi:hypothetical protein
MQDARDLSDESCDAGANTCLRCGMFLFLQPAIALLMKQMGIEMQAQPMGKGLGSNGAQSSHLANRILS